MTNFLVYVRGTCEPFLKTSFRKLTNDYNSGLEPVGHSLPDETIPLPL